MRVIVLAIVLWSATAHAHAASGAHESPRWCGGKLAMLADGGVWIDRVLVPVAEVEGLVAWSPACDVVAVVGSRAHAIDARTGAIHELGALPGHFDHAMRMVGPAQSIRFSPSGKRFAVVVVNQTISDMHLAVFDVAKETSWLVGTTGEVHAFALVDDDTAVIAIRPATEQATRLLRATAAGSKRMNQADYTDGRISLAPVVIAMTTAAGDLVVVEAAGTERTIAHKLDYLQAMSDDGTRALAVVNSRASSIELTGAVHPFDADLGFGLIADQDTGWSTDGTFTIASVTNHGGLKIDDGARPRTWKGLPAGDLSHISIAPDGKRVAFLLEVPEPGKRSRHCDVEAWGRVELYAGDVGATAKKLAVVAHLHHCGIE